MRILMLTRYPRAAASSRYRFFEMQSRLQRRGIETDVRSIFPNDYLAHRFSKRSRLVVGVAKGYGARVKDLFRRDRFDLTYIQSECLPFLPAPIEQLLLRGRTPYVVDYDDAWFHRYDQHSSSVVRLALSHKVARVMAGAAAVTVGSRYLHDYASRHNRNVVMLPTSIDIAKYPDSPPDREAGATFTVGWIGSPATTSYLHAVQQSLRAFVERRGAAVTIIGAGNDPLDIPSLERVPWSEASEVAEVAKFDVGIMPLTDDPFTRGKCAFKLIQYMGCWKPVIASPVGENVVVVDHGKNGYLATTPDEWLRALDAVHADPLRAAEMGRQGRAKIEAGYTLDKTGNALASLFFSLARAGAVA
jgi:glycosyltransferase involved in cell wall biosynthesis